MSIDNALASVPVRDLEASAAWYERLLGRAPNRPMAEVAEWQFDGGGGLQVYEAPGRAGGGSVTLAVTGLDGQVDALRDLGIDSDAVGNDRVRTLMVRDPDGNSIAFAEAIDPQLLR
jgi:catechol 2,3-dioxygenase-like lactoylglutathione lyase family enzyme